MKVDFKLRVNVPFTPGIKPERTSDREDPPPPRPARLAILMALAIRMHELLLAGKVRSQTELAEIGGVSGARVTQIMNLLSLAPDVQEDLLFLDHANVAERRAFERSIRPLLRVANWKIQRMIARPIAAGRRLVNPPTDRPTQQSR